MKMLIQMDKVHNIKWELSSQRIIANIIDEKSPDRSKRFADRLIEVLNKEPKRYANMKGIAGFNSDCINLGCSSRLPIPSSACCCYFSSLCRKV
jgi:hypothetical protein